MDNAAQELASAIGRTVDASGLVLAVTGAGVSAPSGIATFRGDDPGAVWRADDVEIATRAWFERDPAGQWRWFLERFDRVLTAEPNPAHAALAALEQALPERGADFLLVTQNIDTLHEQAGSERLIKVHGTADRFRCSRRGCGLGAPHGSLPRSAVDLGPFRAEPTAGNVPVCPACGATLRAHALFFDEYYHEHRDYGFDRVQRAAERAGLLIFVGTSLSVGVTDLLLRTASEHRIPALSIDPAAPPAAASTTLRRLAEPAEELLPAACRELGIELPASG